MDPCASATDAESRTCDETSFDCESESNTADLSHISGLSKILRDDDSIADRVRCLLASDTEDGDQEKPELLSSAKELPSSNELAERISKLLQDGDTACDTAGNSKGKVEDELQSTANSQSEALDLPVNHDEKNTLSEVTEKVDSESPNTGITTATNGRRSGDGADNEPTTITPESSDDIMNVSDATEYSDLPKVVDNPIKRLSTCTKSLYQVKPNLANDNSHHRVSVQDDKKIELRSPQTKEEITSSSSRDTNQPITSKHADLAKDIKNQSIPQRIQNMTENRDEKLTTRENGPRSGNAQLSSGCLPDENLLSKIRKAVPSSRPISASDSLKGSHTSSAQSIASSIDSLGLKVKNLLKEKAPENAPDANVSSASNYSEEIYNFEKTNLWKYTRQFLPGAVSQPSTIQPHARYFDATSPIVVKDATTDSSAASTPVTYRLARDVVTPVNVAPYLERESFNPSYSRKSPVLHRLSDRDITNSYSMDDSVKTGIPASMSSYNRGGSSEFCPQPSTYSSRVRDGKEYTPSNDSYRSLYPEYSDTPYSFITPRRVAWEPERRTLSSSAHKKNVPMERSAYFNPDHFSDETNNPILAHRTTPATYRRLTPNVTEFASRHDFTHRDKITSTDERPKSSLYATSSIPVSTTPSKLQGHNGADVACNSSSMRPSSKMVRFDKSASPSKSGCCRNDVKLALLPEYSFTTPKIATCPHRNITPKVNRKIPRPSKSLPTYDQMVMEEECRKSLDEKNEEGAVLDNPEISSVIVKKSPAKNSVIRSSTPTETTQANHANTEFMPDTCVFSALKPEICLEDSTCEDDIVRLTEIETNARLSRGIADSEVCFRGVISSDRDVASTSCNGPSISVAKDDAAPNESAIETQPKNSGPSMDTEPAPLPYVRLGRKRTISPFRKGRTPPRHSISTEKVQNLLMKESVPRTGNASVDFGHSMSAVDHSSSSDDDLLHLMETMASKVPLMKQLLEKLYERNLEQKEKQESGMRIHSSQTVDTPATADQCVQTIDSPVKSTNETVAKETVTESCQTSLLQSKKTILVAHKSTSPMEDFDSAVDDEEITQPEPPVDKGNKENNMLTKEPCAFFVDVTPEKSGKWVNATENREKQAMAWYEPYKYVPFWKQEQTQRKTLGFVDANVQNAFLNNKRDFVLRSWERQEDIAHRAQERRLRELEQNIHEQIRALHKEKTFKIASSTLPPTVPKKRTERVFGWKEMKIASKQKYDALPEVVAKKQEAERLKYYEANRKRAEMYKRRITRMIVQKQKGKVSSEVR